jgi:hypothetical protein
MVVMPSRFNTVPHLRASLRRRLVRGDLYRVNKDSGVAHMFNAALETEYAFDKLGV